MNTIEIRKTVVWARRYGNLFGYAVLLNGRTRATFLYEDEAASFAATLRKSFPTKTHDIKAG